MKRNFSQVAASTSPGISTERPCARANASARRSTRSLVPPVPLAELDLGGDARVAHVAGRDDRAHDLAEPAQHALGPEDGRQLVRGGDAVLQRHHERVRAEQRAQRARGLGHLPGLDADQDDVDGPDPREVVVRFRRRDREVALHAVDAQPALADGGEVRPARDERDRLPRLREASAEVRADPARADDRDPHPPILADRRAPSHRATFRRAARPRDVPRAARADRRRARGGAAGHAAVGAARGAHRGAGGVATRAPTRTRASRR